MWASTLQAKAPEALSTYELFCVYFGNTLVPNYNLLQIYRFRYL